MEVSSGSFELLYQQNRHVNVMKRLKRAMGFRWEFFVTTDKKNHNALEEKMESWSHSELKRSYFIVKHIACYFKAYLTSFASLVLLAIVGIQWIKGCEVKFFQFDSNIFQLLGIPGRILASPVTQLFRSKWLYFLFLCAGTVEYCS